MKAHVNGIDPEWKFRAHPYVAIHQGQSGWLNLRETPDRIETDLEDFKPYKDQPAVAAFYKLLRQLNAEDSPLESCDCAFRGPHTHNFETTRGFCTDGRLMILFRELPRNGVLDEVRWLCETLAAELDTRDPDLPEEHALVELWAVSALQLELSLCRFIDGEYWADDDDPGWGYHVLIQFVAFGDDEAAAFETLERLFANLASALHTTALQAMQRSPLGSDSPS
jgi:hypothetical protein